MPYLEIAGLYDVCISSGSHLAQGFPSVRHFTFDNSECKISEEDAALFTCLASQLDSIVLLSDFYSILPSRASAVPIPSILVTLPRIWSDNFTNGTSSAVNLRLQVSDICLALADRSECSKSISNFTSGLDQYPQLETVYLPPIESLPSEYRTESVISALHQFSLECQNRNIEVICEEQSDQINGESQISEEFMRRMTRKRIEKEAAAAAEEK
ncbi:hypothetical protein JCM3765_006159 [Sporobolomyces pararoseus]